ncbi:MAG: RNA 2',3'-cyclic phosphodiesterase, partial [Nitrospiraceae bacterium]|nr:RNA 2',3'-cyclic phosphodiesterase [Nitrospiraceae bacterium]
MSETIKMGERGLVRCFVAVEIPGDIRERIERETAFLRRSRADVKWVPAENLHFTVKFLGGVPEEEIPGLVRILTEAVRQTKPFEIEIAGAGVFPGTRSPRVFWVGAREEGPESRFRGLAEVVEDALSRG